MHDSPKNQEPRKEMGPVDYFTFADNFYPSRENVVENRVPTEGFLELTRLCPLKCVHCYIGDARWTRDPNELTTEEIYQLLDAFAANGTLWLTLTGGEPLLRKDFSDIWISAHQRGFLLALYTNAILFDEKIAALMKKYPPYKIEVSIYGASAETYERMTKTPGSYPKFLQGVENIRSVGCYWRLKACLVRETAHEWQNLQDQAKNWGTSLQKNTLIFPSIGEGKTGGLSPCASRLTEEEAVDLELKDQIGNSDFLRNAEASCSSETSSKLFSCGAGKNSFYTTASGNLQMCTMTPHRAESVRGEAGIAEHFKRGWERFGEARKIQRSEKSPCLTCDLQAICTTCPGLAQLETGNEESPVAWACRLTHLKALKLGVKHRCDVSHFIYQKTET